MALWEMSGPGRGASRRQSPESEGTATRPVQLEGSKREAEYRTYKTNDLHWGFQDFLPGEEERCGKILMLVARISASSIL